MNSLLVILWIISMALMFVIPYSIAVFYQRSFKRKTYPYFFIVSFLLLVTSSLGYWDQFFTQNLLFFALGGILLVGSSLRLDQVMTGREK
ncbi:MAG: hypothetical protein Q7J35_10795 [Candidatus Methanoperedens sp.]|nr:hypothetical protein [Candidatus Methanoperedens sp.]